MRGTTARHRVVARMRRTIGLRRRAAEILGFRHRVAEVAQTLVAQIWLAPRIGFVRLAAFRPRPLGGVVLDPADRFLQRQPLARDVGFVERGLDAAQLGDQRAARALVQRTAVLAGVLVEAGDGAGDQGVIVSHCLST